MPLNNELPNIVDFDLDNLNKNRFIDTSSPAKFFNLQKKNDDIKRLENKIDKLTDLIKMIFGKSVLINGRFVDISKIEV